MRGCVLLELSRKVTDLDRMIQHVRYHARTAEASSSAGDGRYDHGK
jgi:hypothetical protein